MQQLFTSKKVSFVISQVLEKLNHGLEVRDGFAGHVGFLHPSSSTGEFGKNKSILMTLSATVFWSIFLRFKQLLSLSWLLPIRCKCHDSLKGKSCHSNSCQHAALSH